MYFQLCVIVTLLEITSVGRVIALFFHPNVAEDVSADYENNENYEPKKDLRKSFLEKKKLNEEQNINVKLLQGILKSEKKEKTIYVYDIPHNEAYNGTKIYNAMKKLENEFLGLLRMINFKYIFKRDRYWRTWREVKYPNGTKIVYNYKSHNLVDIKPNCTDCTSFSGFWDIEDKSPPCPYEISFMKTASLVCGSTHQILQKKLASCPMKIKYLDLISTCSNPIVTKWKLEKIYSKRAPNYTFLVGARDNYFEIVTLYRMQDSEIIFQIVNSTNEVIYSKIMHPGNKNYVCLEDCGVFNPTTLRITKKDSPLSLDLLNYAHNAKKRENKKGGVKGGLIKKKKYILTTKKPSKTIEECAGYTDASEESETGDSDANYLAAEAIAKKIKKFKHHHHKKHKTGKKKVNDASISLCRKIIIKSKVVEASESDSDTDYSY